VNKRACAPERAHRRGRLPVRAHGREPPVEDNFPAIDYFERREIPFIVGLNHFDGALRYDPEDVRVALDLDPHLPIVTCDARSRESAKEVLIALVEHVLMATEEPVGH
jgi:signal recognition particle receptor subunit beta